MVTSLFPVTQPMLLVPAVSNARFQYPSRTSLACTHTRCVQSLDLGAIATSLAILRLPAAPF